MADNLTSYGEFPRYWNPNWLKQLFNLMIIAGTAGIVIGSVFDNHRITGASAASTGAGTVGRIILCLFGY